MRDSTRPSDAPYERTSSNMHREDIHGNKRLTYVVNLVSADDSQHFVHIPNLLNELEALGWDIELVSERGGVGTGIIAGRPFRYLSHTSKTKRIFNLVRTFIGMRRQGGRLVFVRITKSGGFVSGILGRLLGWKTIYWLSGTVEDFNQASGFRSRLSARIVALLLRVVDRLATGPETMVDYYASVYGLPKSKIILLYNDVALRPAPVPVAKTADTVRLLIVHRLSPVRETARYFPAILKALDDLKSAGISAVLDVVGDGPERIELEEMTEGRTDVRFHGTVAQRELEPFYSRASIFLMPSYREGFPRVIIEAMAYGLPIVSTDAGGSRDLFGPAQLEFVSDRADPADFGKAIFSLASSPAIQRELAAQNLERVQRYSTPAVAAMYDRALTALLP